MKTQVLKYLDRVRGSFWFLPSMMAGGAVVLAMATVALDEAVTDRWQDTLSWAYSGGAAGASAVLQTIAGSMITIAGVVFSLTLVALSLASSQFGPRLLRNFMRDTANQVVLGTFVATFLYCLLVLRTIRYDGNGAFVPHLSVTFGVAFALASLWVLIYFIHHVSVSIQADEIVSRVSEELIASIDRLWKEQENREGDRAPDRMVVTLPDTFEREARSVASPVDGYLQMIDMDALVAAAAQADAIVRLQRRPGQYVVAGGSLLLAWPAARIDDDVAARFVAAFVLGNQRTPTQDLEFSVHQLVEIAARALSPGVNDPFTAITCVDRLGSALCRLARREVPSPFRFDASRNIRVVAIPGTFTDIADAALNQIRQHARTDAAVTIRLLETIAVVAAHAHRPQDRDALARHAEMILRGASDGLPEPEDRRQAQQRFDDIGRALARRE
ncbi:MAG: DUF2254 domain-containing protein [Betaproteobacteria bacterium]